MTGIVWLDLALTWLPWVVTVASGVTAVTPTPKDDGILKLVYRVIESVGLVIGRAKDR